MGKKKETLTVEHELWGEFINRLNDEAAFSMCDGTTDKPIARKVLAEHFPSIDVESTMSYFDERGGHCDCEILLNVDR